MSSPNGPGARRVITSPQADLDIEDILNHSIDTRGESQAAAYYKRLQQALRGLETFASIGRRRDDLFGGCRSLPVEQHVVYYRIDGVTVRIARILHRRMNPRAHVTGNE
jgi:toxin ParE1/3/4